MKKIIETECGIIGGGSAGMSCAIELADAGKKVDLFVKGELIEDSNSYLIAGGLAGVPDKKYNINEDNYEIHIEETLKAGAGLNNGEVVKYCVEHFFEDVTLWLIKQGVKFDMDKNGLFDLHREGGHSKNRIVHAKDTTGIEIMNVLGTKVMNHPNIKVHENHMAIDLVSDKKLSSKENSRERGLGFYVYDNENDLVKSISAQGTFLATGGLGKVFMYTSNSDISSGDGFAISSRAGLPLANMEFIQFHPTVFYDASAVNEGERRFLLTEALRGEGAILKIDKDGKEDLVIKYHELGSKATRDVVSRAEESEMRKNGLNHVWLDCRVIGEERLKNDFKNSYEFCLTKGFDLAKESIPVVFAEHYSNGGVIANLNGETEIKGVYVIGETAYTGLHGATRLASNSAPECILFGRKAAKHFISRSNIEGKVNSKISEWKETSKKEFRDKATVSYYWDTIRRTMTSLCGIERNEERLIVAKKVIDTLKEDINNLYWNYKVSKNFLEVRNIADVASIIVEGALSRRETRACHFREDYPETVDQYYGTSIIRNYKSGPESRIIPGVIL